MKKLIFGLMNLNNLSLKDAEELFLHAYDKNIRYFDIADIYGNGGCEVVFGEILKLHKNLRKNIIIQTKCGICNGYYDFSYEHIISSVKNSLKRMGLDYVDILLLHRPDVLVDFKELNNALNYLKNNNLVKRFGVCNMNKSFFKLLQDKVDVKLEINQLEFSLTSTQLIDHILNMNTNNDLANDKVGEIVEYCYMHDIELQAWSPLKVSLSEGGFINNPKYQELNETLDKLASKYQTNKASVSLSFIMRLPFNIAPIFSCSNIKHFDECIESLNIDLSKKDWYLLYLKAGHILP